MPSGEVFHVSADDLPKGGQDAIRRVLFVTAAGAAPRTIPRRSFRRRTARRARRPRTRADLRFDANAAGQIFVLNKADGTIRVVER